MAPTEPDNAEIVASNLQRAFFSAPNRFVHDRASSDVATQQAFSQSLRYHAQGNDDRPILFAYKDHSASGTSWYACVPTEAMARAALSELNAFLGPSFVNFVPLDRPNDEADQHALSLISAAGWRAIRFDSSEKKGSDELVLRQWRSYWQLLERRPRTASYVPKTFDQLRATFDRALVARCEAAALGAMSSLRERFGVSAENRKYLEIRIAAAFGRWEQIAGHPLLAHLVHLKLPPETYGDVTEALYRVHVQPFEHAPRIEDLLSQFGEKVAQAGHPLFRSRHTSRRPAVLKAFLLHELNQTQPQAAVCENLLTSLPVGAFGHLDEAIRARVAALSTRHDLAAARQALDDELFDRAWTLFWSLADSIEVFRGLIVCARESEDPAKAETVLARLDSATPEVRRAVEKASTARLAKLRALTPPSPPAHSSPEPATWATQLRRGSSESNDRYVERWREMARSVDPEQLLSEEGFARAAVDCLMEQALDEPQVFERLYPLWHELFVERTDPDRRLAPLYAALLEVLRIRDVFTETERELLHQTLVALVQTGDDNDYRRSVEEVFRIFETIRSPQAIGWALDVCDSLAKLRTRDADARMRLLLCVVQACTEFDARLTPVQRHLLGLLAREAHIELPTRSEQSEAEPTKEGALEERLRVAFYSLDEPAIRRAAEILKALHPHWQLDINCDPKCSDKLKGLAQSAHVFVFAWRCSKHAAYDCVKAAIRVKDRLVMARGVGTTSLVSAALDRITQEANGFR